MRVIDARSGLEMAIGKTVTYPEGTSHTLLQVEPGLLTARALVRGIYQDSSKPGYPWVTRDEWVDMPVRWMHPAFLLQHVAFFPS